MEAILNGPTGRTTLGPGVLTIGRMPGNQLLMTDSQSSGHHAEIRPTGQGYSIVDLSSTNGTFVNEQQLAPNIPRQLVAGDRIRIGQTVFTYEVSGADALAPTAYINQPAKGGPPAIEPTVAVPPPPLAAYGANAQQNYQQPPPPPGYQPPFTPPAPPPQPQYAPPGYIPPVPLQKKSRRGLWITLSVIGAILLLACIGCAVLVLLTGNSTPTRTLTTFCNDLKNSDYHDAYQQLSTRAQSKESEAEFTATLQNTFARGGGLKDCTISNVDDASGTGLMTWTLNLSAIPPVNFNCKLVSESSTWKIDQIIRRT